MTTIVMKGYSLALKETATIFFSGIFRWIGSIGSAIQVSRQMAANEQIARHMLHEYPEHTYYSLLAELNHKTMVRFTKDV